ncbi:MAG: hypothetical protein EZS28_048066 [Streblomastix strix]|uniref:Uncharacterized protein n=1 Tax=Streblomastix strix TaxID=222440 RepID=A0A5J4TD75_9EUKA|nr:MAG: hypothetical protein EZS28_048066 [Streblomastix strix]
MDKDDIYDIKEYLCQILKMLDETQYRFNMTVTLNEINSKLDRMIDQPIDKPSHQSPSQQSALSEVSQLQFLYPYRNIEQKIKADNERQLEQDKIEQQMKADYDKKLKKDDIKYIDETIYSVIEGEPQSKLTYDEIQQMRRKLETELRQTLKENKDMLQQRGIKMKNLGFTIPTDQDVDVIMNQIRQTITERSIH